MVLHKRIIPVLLLKDKGLVKGKNIRNHRYIGDPLNAVRIFNSKEVDELIFLDILASKTGTPIDIDLVQNIADECYIPFAVGGGIKEISEIKNLLSAGCEKVCINTSCYKNVELINEASKYFGSQSIIGSVDVKTNWLGQKSVYILSGSKKISLNYLEYCKSLQSAGCGEIMLTSINHDGMMSGYDKSIALELSKSLDIPVIINGGAGKLEHISEALMIPQISAVAAGSIFVFHGPKKGILITYPNRELIFEVLKNA